MSAKIKTLNSLKMGENRDQQYFEGRKNTTVEINGKTYVIEKVDQKDGRFVYDLKEQNSQTLSEYKGISAEMLDNFLNTEELSKEVEKIKETLKLKNREVFEKIQKISQELIKVDNHFVGKNSEIENWSKIKAKNMSVEVDKIKADVENIKKDLEKIEKGELAEELHDKLKEKVFEDKKNQLKTEKENYKNDLAKFNQEKKDIEKREEEIKDWIAKNQTLFNTTKAGLENKIKNNNKGKNVKVNITDSQVIKEIIDNKLANPLPPNFLSHNTKEPKEPGQIDLDINKFTDDEKNTKYFEKLEEISENKNSYYDAKIVELAKKTIEEMEKLSGGVVFDFKNLNPEAKKEVFARAEKVLEKFKKENTDIFDIDKEIKKTKKDLEKKYKELENKEIKDSEIKKKLEEWKMDFDSCGDSEGESLDLLKKLHDLELQIIRKEIEESGENTDNKEVEKPETKEINIHHSVLKKALKQKPDLVRRIEGFVLEGVFSDRGDLLFAEAESALEEMFDSLKQETSFLDNLKKAGFPDFDSFIRRFKEGEMAKKTIETMKECMYTEIKRVAMIEGGFFSAFKEGKLKQNWKNILKVGGVWGARIALTVGAVAGGVWAAGGLFAALGLIGGVGGAAAGGAVGGAVRQALNSILKKVGFDKALESGVEGIRKTEQKYQMDKMKELMKKDPDKNIEELSMILSESLRQESLKGVVGEEETDETKNLKSDAKKLYIDFLKRAREEGKEVNEKDRLKLIEVLQVMQQKDELKMEEINKLASGTIEFLDSKVSSFFKAMSGKVEGKKGTLSAMATGATVGGAFWADNAVARVVLGGLGGASLGYKLFGKGRFEKKMEKEVKIKYDKMVAEYQDILDNNHNYTMDQMKDSFKKMEEIYEGNDKENLDLTYYLNQHPKEKTKFKQKLLHVSNRGWLEDKNKEIIKDAESRLSRLEQLVGERGKETDKFVKEQVKKWKKENGQKIEDSKVTALAVTAGAVGMAAFSFAVGVGVQHLKAEYLSENSDTNIAPGNTEKVVGAAVGAKVISENINSGVTPETVSPGSGDTAIVDKPVDSESVTGSEAKDGVTTDTSSQEEVPETKEEVPETKEKTVEEPLDEQKPKNEEIYKIQKGDGYNDVFKRQIGADPEKFGYKEGDDLDKFINNKAKEFLKANNLWKNGKGVGLRYNPEAKIILNEDGSLTEEGVKTYKMEIPKVEKVPAPVEQEQIKDGDVPEKTEPVLSQKEVMASKVEEAIARLEAVKESNSALYKTFTKQIELGYSKFNQSGDVADLEKTFNKIEEIMGEPKTETASLVENPKVAIPKNLEELKDGLKKLSQAGDEKAQKMLDKIDKAENLQTKNPGIKTTQLRNVLRQGTDYFQKLNKEDVGATSETTDTNTGKTMEIPKVEKVPAPVEQEQIKDGDVPEKTEPVLSQKEVMASKVEEAIARLEAVKESNSALYKTFTKQIELGYSKFNQSGDVADLEKTFNKIEEIMGEPKTETASLVENPKVAIPKNLEELKDGLKKLSQAGDEKAQKMLDKIDKAENLQTKNPGIKTTQLRNVLRQGTDYFQKLNKEDVGATSETTDTNAGKTAVEAKDISTKETIDKTGETKNYKEETLPKEQAKIPEGVKDEYQYTKNELAEIQKANEYLDRLAKTDGIKADDWKWDMENLTGEEKIDLAKHILNSEKADLEAVEDAKIASDREEMRIAKGEVYDKMLKEKMESYDESKAEEAPKTEQNPEEQKNTESPNKHRAEALKAINVEDEKPVEKMIEEDIEENKSDIDNIKAEQVARFENRGAGAIAEITKNFNSKSYRFGGPELKEEFETLQDIYEDAVKNGKAGDLEAVAEQLEGLRDYQNFVNSKSNIQEVIRYNNNMVSLEGRDMSGKFGNLYRTGEALGKKWTDSSDLFDVKGLKSTVKEMTEFNKEFEKMTVGEREPEMTKQRLNMFAENTKDMLKGSMSESELKENIRKTRE